MRLDTIYRATLKPIIDDTPLRGILASFYEYLILKRNNHRLHLSANGHDATFKLDSLSDYYGLKNCAGEGEIIEDLLQNLREGDVFFDIGSHLGLYSGFVAADKATDNIVAFDADSENLRKTRSNVNMNGEDAETYCLAVGADRGFIAFDLEAVDSSVFQTRAQGRHHVAQYPLDEILPESELPEPTVMKIDIEGAEYGLIQGASDTLENVRVLYCEVHKEQLPDPKKIDTTLREMGFDVNRLYESPETYQLRAVRA